MVTARRTPMTTFTRFTRLVFLGGEVPVVLLVKYFFWVCLYSFLVVARSLKRAKSSDLFSFFLG